MTLTVIIPTIEPRRELLHRAIASVRNQTVEVEEIIIQHDNEKQGAAATRQKALDQVTTDFVLPLDDDDELKPNGVELLLAHQKATGADMVYGHYDVIGGDDPRPENLGRDFDPLNPVQTTIVVLSKTSLAQKCGYVNPHDGPLNSPDRLYAGEDWYFIQQALANNYSISHCPHKVFDWYHHGANTSGLPKNW